MAYTVDEVSDTLGVPRPTLYRYLREYSVPHLRRAGKIYVPEEAFDRIQEIRELHREGLDTESVRRRLQEGSSTGAEGLVERLDRISETLEDLGGSSKPIAVDGASTAQALQTVLARQTLLISAVSNLTGMIEDLLAVNGLRRKVNPDNPETAAWEQETFVDSLERNREAAEENGPATNGSAVEAPPGPAAPRSSRPSTIQARREKFGRLTRRRRRGILVILLALLTGAVLIYTLSYGGAFRVLQEEPPEPTQEEAPASSEEVSAENSVAPSLDPAGQDEEAPTSNTEEDYEASGQDQASYPESYPVQDVAPGPFYQEQPIQQDVVPGLPYGGQPVPQPGDVGFAPAPQ